VVDEVICGTRYLDVTVDACSPFLGLAGQMSIAVFKYFAISCAGAAFAVAIGKT
jgi:hypothetical protein